MYTIALCFNDLNACTFKTLAHFDKPLMLYYYYMNNQLGGIKAVKGAIYSCMGMGVCACECSFNLGAGGGGDIIRFASPIIK